MTSVSSTYSVETPLRFYCGTTSRALAFRVGPEGDEHSTALSLYQRVGLVAALSGIAPRPLVGPNDIVVPIPEEHAADLSGFGGLVQDVITGALDRQMYLDSAGLTIPDLGRPQFLAAPDEPIEVACTRLSHGIAMRLSQPIPGLGGRHDADLAAAMQGEWAGELTIPA